MISPADSAHPASAKPAPVSLDLDLLRKYAGPAPRYTSYPPATLFTPDLEPLRLDEALVDDNGPDAGPLSLYFHLPFCETRCWYCGCTTVITRRRSAADEYLDDLERELKLLAEPLNPSRQVTQLHLGGGTPTFFNGEQLRRLQALVRGRFQFARDAEISVEIDPRRLTEDHIGALREFGVNRASLGIQDTDRAVQLAIHRYQPQDLNERAFAWLREAGVGSINVDLIYGLPLQSRTTFARTLSDVLALGPDRLSVFSYAHVPWLKPSQKIFEDRGQLPEAEEKLAMFSLAHETLTGAGFVDVGLDHFARPQDELAVALSQGTLHRNFQGYTTRAGASLYGLGLSSISQTRDTYRQNHKDWLAYKKALAAGRWPTERGYRLNADDHIRREAVMGLMCARRIDFEAFERRTGVAFRDYFARECLGLADLLTDGILKMDTESLSITSLGVPLLRVAAARFDATLGRSPGRHAKAI